MMKFENIILLIPAYMPSRELAGFVGTLLEKGFSRIVVMYGGSGKEYMETFYALTSEIRALRHDLIKARAERSRHGFALFPAA